MGGDDESHLSRRVYVKHFLPAFKRDKCEKEGRGVSEGDGIHESKGAGVKQPLRY